MAGRLSVRSAMGRVGEGHADEWAGRQGLLVEPVRFGVSVFSVSRGVLASVAVEVHIGLLGVATCRAFTVAPTVNVLLEEPNLVL